MMSSTRTAFAAAPLQARACAMGLVVALTGSPGLAAPASCRATTGPTATPVIELYTSEGCNSCPPADRWLAAFKDRDDVVAMAFHVDYWDRLGWVDRFASHAFTERQVQQQAVNGARFAYTPQVVVDGRDRKDWPDLPLPSTRAAARVRIELARAGEDVTAQVRSLDGASPRLAAYWVVTEFGHRTAVRAGENAGVTLAHEFVVRELQLVPPWAASPQATQTLRFTPRRPAESGHARRVDLVVTDAAGGRPLQALSLGC